jgi:CelD/BcsL family acetyltransferase involved in cellulose biosynthesis
MRADIVPLDDLAPADLAAWCELAARAQEPNPFHDPRFVVPAARGAKADVGLLVARRGGEWAACVPVVRARTWRRVPLPCLAVWRHPNCLLGTPLLGEHDPLAAANALLDRAVAEPRSAFLALEWLGAGGPVAAAFEAAASGRPARCDVVERFERATLARRPRNDYLDGRLSPRRRKDLRRLARRLEAELGGPVEVRDRAGDAAAVEDFLRLEASGWKGREGTAMASDPAEAGFFRSMCEAFARSGALELLSLEVAGQPLAMQCNLLAGDTLFCFKVAYDEAYARHGAGTQLEIAAIAVFHGRPELRRMDSCADPDNELLNRLWPERRAIETVAVATGGLRHAAVAALRARTAASRLRRQGSGAAA